MFLESRARIAIYDASTNELWHSESFYGTQGPEMLVHEDASQVYRFFAEDRPIVAYVEARFDDTVQQWKRSPEDVCFKLTSTFTR